MRCETVILAAGLGTRMRSKLPKVLHPLLGRPLLGWTVEACREATGSLPYVVVGREADEIREAFGDRVRFVVQNEPLGTGHALLQASGSLEGAAVSVLVVSADMPLLTSGSLRRLIQLQEETAGPLTLLSHIGDRPRGFGRVVRDDRSRIERVVEEAHATPGELALREYNASVYCFRGDWLWGHLAGLPLSPKGEYYLTDLVEMAAREGEDVASLQVEDPDELIGVNTREHLAEAETALRARINRGWMLEGVSIVDPAVAYIGPEVRIGPDTTILPNTHLWGRSSIGSGCTVGPNSIIRDSRVGDGCRITASVIEEAVIEQGADVGPFSHLRPGAHLMEGVHVGNFGEIKNSTLGPRSKMGHFSYVGDSTVGEEANIGAGTITCNFGRDGKKHRTEIGDRAFIGSDTMLVAPVRVGKGAATGAGAVVTKDVPDDGLAVGMPARVIRKLTRGG
jgi:bifunctional UDP-N-acetylglucosamine pyrophosphorylase/glucosamine-1-phosphate N-acetyltransferase